MKAVSGLIIGLLGLVLGMALFGGAIYLGFGPAIQQQTNDQSDQVSTMKNDPRAGTVNISPINGSETPSHADTFN